MLMQVQGATVDLERHRGEARRHARHRSAPEARATRPSTAVRMGAAFMRVVRRERHSLTAYACRLPDGTIGRTAVVQSGGEWTLVCRVA
jgi:hypothetical protein